jgi:hypothetical protein
MQKSNIAGLGLKYRPEQLSLTIELSIQVVQVLTVSNGLVWGKNALMLCG